MQTGLHASSATATANFAVCLAYWSNLQDGGIQTAFFFAVAGSRALESILQNVAAGEMGHRMQSVLHLLFFSNHLSMN